MLNRLKAWNPGWCPTHFMVDKSAAEQSAVAAAYPQARILLCDFHRLQAQWRWLNSGKSCLKNDGEKRLVFKQLRAIGEAGTTQDLSRRIEAFTSSAAYRSNSALQRYWVEHWASCLKLWVACYRQVCGL
jgi:hypothetical protein